ncbi:MAG: hypothetical protein H0Z29_03915 [Candidatus Marinimicrobia bacterium]|nr:hypothetical protein [Candidatus Neomarinimicrobiota bacterium]
MIEIRKIERIRDKRFIGLRRIVKRNWTSLIKIIEEDNSLYGFTRRILYNIKFFHSYQRRYCLIFCVNTYFH